MSCVALGACVCAHLRSAVCVSAAVVARPGEEEFSGRGGGGGVGVGGQRCEVVRDILMSL